VCFLWMPLILHYFMWQIILPSLFGLVLSRARFRFIVGESICIFQIYCWWKCMHISDLLVKVFAYFRFIVGESMHISDLLLVKVYAYLRFVGESACISQICCWWKCMHISSHTPISSQKSLFAQTCGEHLQFLFYLQFESAIRIYIL
jgi:hypothetical protein